MVKYYINKAITLEHKGEKSIGKCYHSEVKDGVFSCILGVDKNIFKKTVVIKGKKYTMYDRNKDIYKYIKKLHKIGSKIWKRNQKNYLDYFNNCELS